MREFATGAETSPTEKPGSLSARIRTMTAELRDLEKFMKSERDASNTSLLFEFRTALDNARMTAWVMSELANAHQTKVDRNAMSAYLTSERIRRFAQLVRDLCADLDSGQIKPQTTGMRELQQALEELEMHVPQTNQK